MRFDIGVLDRQGARGLDRGRPDVRLRLPLAYPHVMPNRLFAFLLPKPKPAPPPSRAVDSIVVTVGARDLTVRLRRNARAKRYTLRVDAKAAGAVVTIPRRGTIAEARAFVARHADWLAARIVDPEERPALGPGSLVPVRGVPHRIVPTGTARGTVRATLDAAGRPVLMVPGDPAHHARRIEDHLKRLARADLTAAVERHATALGVKPTALRLKDTTSRWGSATTAGTLSFSWRLVMAPPFVLDYLAAHEVAHLKEMNHSDRFWAICRRLAPRTDEAKAWLTAEGRASTASREPPRPQCDPPNSRSSRPVSSWLGPLTGTSVTGSGGSEPVGIAGP